jgi:hypothetical protein
MSLSRRKFMKAGVLAAAFGAALPLKSALAQNSQPGRAGISNGGLQPPLSDKTGLEQLNYYTESSFAPYLNTQFRIYLSPSSTRALRLIEVSDYMDTLPKSAMRGNSSKTECFSLLMTIPPGKSFEQDTYLIEHDALGTFYMFMVPVGEKGKRGVDYYEAIIYRHPDLPKGYEASAFNGKEIVQGQARNADALVMGSSSGGRKSEQDVFYFRPNEIASVPIPPVDPGAAGRRAAARMTVAQTPDIGGLKLGMTVEQALALFPGSKNDESVRASLSRPISPLGVQTLKINPEKYAVSRFGGVSQIIFTFLDGRLATLYVGYASPAWGHVDEFVTKFSGETKLPGADSWDGYAGMENQLKTLKGSDFEISIFTGAGGLKTNYVQLSNTTARQTLQARRAAARKTNSAKP